MSFGQVDVGTSCGALALVHVWSIPVALALFALLRRVIPHSPRAMLATMAGVMFVRYGGDWGRVYGGGGGGQSDDKA